jgi:hypothetical protein
VLPSPAELRELSQRIREAVPEASTKETKQLLAGYAFRLAQVAEQLERKGAFEFARSADIERYEQLLTEALAETTRSTVDTLLREKDKRRRQIRAWRLRAEETRAVAGQFTVPSVQESLRRIAANLDQMADHAEGLLQDGPSTASEKAG